MQMLLFFYIFIFKQYIFIFLYSFNMINLTGFASLHLCIFIFILK